MRLQNYENKNQPSVQPTKGTFTAANEISFTGHVSITGGTGRFASATGNLLSVVSGNIFATVTDSFTGTITY